MAVRSIAICFLLRSVLMCAVLSCEVLLCAVLSCGVLLCDVSLYDVLLCDFHVMYCYIPVIPNSEDCFPTSIN